MKNGLSKDGQYGGNESFDEVEYKLDERAFRLQFFILLTNSVTGAETDRL